MSREYPVSNRGQKERQSMVRLDEKLLLEAAHCIEASNVHLLEEMMFSYEQAVELHNAYSPDHAQYDAIHELRLRCYVVTHHLKKIPEDSNATKRAIALIERTLELHPKSKLLGITNPDVLD